ncbi:MAG: hypothetical protein H8D45_20500 [Bacteroidetes bacterium]|nr:hypothetical protein [Bacteroidota bacterium]MBL7104754.1 hypothetical protein [Bacteroidales bacterium]
MKHLIEIDDGTKAGETLLNLAEILSKKSKGIDLLRHEIIEEMEDLKLLRKMEDSRKTGLADTEEVLKKLGL